MSEVLVTMGSGVMGLLLGVGMVRIVMRAEDRKPIATRVFALSLSWLAYIFVLFLVVPS